MNDDESVKDYIRFKNAPIESLTTDQRQGLFKEICALAEAGVTFVPGALRYNTKTGIFRIFDYQMVVADGYPANLKRYYSFEEKEDYYEYYRRVLNCNT